MHECYCKQRKLYIKHEQIYNGKIFLKRNLTDVGMAQ